MYGRRTMETYSTICKIANWNLLYGSGNSNRGSISTWEIVEDRGAWWATVSGLAKSET